MRAPGDVLDEPAGICYSDQQLDATNFKIVFAPGNRCRHIVIRKKKEEYSMGISMDISVAAGVMIPFIGTLLGSAMVFFMSVNVK